MKIPSELINYIETELINNHSQRNYAETVDNYYGKITIHVWSIHFFENNDYEIKEVYRENENHKRVNSDFYYTQLGGWQTLWTAKKYSYYGVVYPENKMCSWHGKKPNLSFVKHLWNYNDIRKMDKSLKYFYVDESERQVDLIEFIKKWREYPVLEILSKIGIHYFYTDKRVLELEGDRKKLFTTWIKNNKKYVLENKPPYNEIINCAKNNITPEQYEKNYGKDAVKKFLKKFRYSDNEYKEINIYLKKQYCAKDIYRDYLDMCIEEGMNIYDRGVMFPKNIIKAHDELYKMKEARVNKQHDLELAKISKILTPLTNSDDDFSIIIPKSHKEFIGVGEKLHNCVGRYGYAEKMANGKIIIAVVCKDNQYLECCELKKEKKTLSVVQLRGDHNQDSKYHKEAKDTIKLFIEKYNKNNISRALAR